MSELSRFLKKNKVIANNTNFAVTKSLTDENGKPLEWTIRAISIKDNDILKDECTKKIFDKSTRAYIEKFNTNLYIKKLMCASVVYPDLNNKELQDSYGVMNPEDLIVEMIGNIGEYADFARFIQEFNGFTEFTSTFSDEVDEAKN